MESKTAERAWKSGEPEHPFHRAEQKSTGILQATSWAASSPNCAQGKGVFGFARAVSLIHRVCV